VITVTPAPFSSLPSCLNSSSALPVSQRPSSSTHFAPADTARLMKAAIPIGAGFARGDPAPCSPIV
jgi:hypothetical protein